MTDPVVGPAECPSGHRLDYPNVIVGSDVNQFWWLCRTCGLTIHRAHDTGAEWVTPDHPG